MFGVIWVDVFEKWSCRVVEFCIFIVICFIIVFKLLVFFIFNFLSCRVWGLFIEWGFIFLIFDLGIVELVVGIVEFDIRLRGVFIVNGYRFYCGIFWLEVYNSYFVYYVFEENFC